MDWLHLYCAFLVYFNQPKHLTTHTTFTHILTQHQDQVGVQYLARGHVDMWTGGARDWTTDLLIGGQPALPPDSCMLISSKLYIYITMRKNASKVFSQWTAVLFIPSGLRSHPWTWTWKTMTLEQRYISLQQRVSSTWSVHPWSWYLFREQH